VFVALGICTSAPWMSLPNTMLTAVRESFRPNYMGQANPTAGLLTPAPVTRCWGPKAASYPALFAVAAGLTGASPILSLLPAGG
jgi:hypothetical protein